MTITDTIHLPIDPEIQFENVPLAPGLFGVLQWSNSGGGFDLRNGICLLRTRPSQRDCICAGMRVNPDERVRLPMSFAVQTGDTDF